jgi:hypothetical protein
MANRTRPRSATEMAWRFRFAGRVDAERSGKGDPGSLATCPALEHRGLTSRSPHGIGNVESEARAARPVSRLVITLPPGQQLAKLNQPAIALSPDGSHLAYVAIQGGMQQLYLRAMDSPEATPILGSQGGFYPFFSPDGQWVGFIADQKLKKVSVNRGAAQTLADASLPNGVSWVA